MKRRACSLALAAAIGLLALSLLGGAAAGDSGGSTGAPPVLTHRFPLGTHTLSHTKTAPARGAAASTTPSGGSTTTSQRNSATTPRGAPATTSHRHGAAPVTTTRTHGGVPGVALLAVIPALIILALLGRVLVRRSHRTRSRNRAGGGDRALVPAPAPDGARERARDRIRRDDQTARPDPAAPPDQPGGARWGFVDKEEVEPPSLPVREPPELPVREPASLPVQQRAKSEPTPRVSRSTGGRNPTKRPA